MMRLAVKKGNEKMIDLDSSGSPANSSKAKPSRYGIVSAITESVLAGLSLFSAFVIQRAFLNLGGSQFLIGRTELFKISASIAFCYAFIFVLRRGYLNYTNGFRETAKRQARYAAEVYIIFLAILFLFKDINFSSAKLSIGLGFILCLLALGINRPILNLFYGKSKSGVARRSITLTKQPLAVHPSMTSPRYGERQQDFLSGLKSLPDYVQRSAKVFVINSVEDIKRLELLDVSEVSHVRVGNLALGEIPEAVKAVRRKGLRLEISPADDFRQRQGVSGRS
jgi:hypothetical protein